LEAAADRIRADFAAVSPLPADALARAYLQRGWWLRRLKFLRAHALRQR
ncbi:glycosyl transferase family 2, partial [Paracidovorax avenae]